MDELKTNTNTRYQVEIIPIFGKSQSSGGTLDMEMRARGGKEPPYA